MYPLDIKHSSRLCVRSKDLIKLGLNDTLTQLWSFSIICICNKSYMTKLFFKYDELSGVEICSA